jgi:soluble lytic murein transglycosylase-like protein
MHSCTFRKFPVFVLAILLVAAAAGQASAELLFFSGDRTMSVKSHRLEGDKIIVTLRGGGEMTFDRGVIARIGPDEVPYDEPVVTIAAAQDTPVVSALAAQLIENTTYEPLIQRAAAMHGVDPRLVKAVIQTESAYQPGARSPKGAMGLMQLMPNTARQYQARNAYDPRANIEAGVKYLRALLDQFEPPLAIAAYNAGEGSVRRFGGIPPFPETQAYVTKVMGLAGLVR